MTEELKNLYHQYLMESSLIEMWGQKPVSTFEEWLKIKTKDMKKELEKYNLAEFEAYIFYRHSKECYKAFMHGVKWSDENQYWRDANEDKPRQDEEVIALVGDSLMISFAHIVNKKYAVDYDGWNIPDVKYWMPCPKIEEEE